MIACKNQTVNGAIPLTQNKAAEQNGLRFAVSPVATLRGGNREALRQIGVVGSAALHPPYIAMIMLRRMGAIHSAADGMEPIVLCCLQLFSAALCELRGLRVKIRL